MRRSWVGAVELGFGLTLNAAAIGAGATLIDRRQALLDTAHEPARAPSVDAARPGVLPRDEPLPSSTAPVASYTLRARLDAPSRAIAGSGRIDWVNRARVPTAELYFHLYLNGFKNSETVLNRSPFVRPRGGLGSGRFGHVQLKKLVAPGLGGADLLAGAELHSPGDPNDSTDLRIALPRPIEPGEPLVLELEWESVLPDLTARTGVSQDFFFAGQWFPKLARLEPDGTWAHFPFHPYAEFYADFGDYDVTLDVPGEMIVGATGARVSEHVEGDRRQVRHTISSVHDFAWTAWRGFRERSERIADVDVRLLYPPGHERNAERTLETLRFGLPHFNGAYGVYPYPVLTVVHPPAHAEQAGGMEYPTLITTGGPWHQSHWSRLLEAVTLHELGHQWFYGLVATNERRWPVLDEGLNSYAESVASELMLGEGSGAELPGLTLSADAVRRLLSAPEAADGPLALDAAEFADFNQLGALVYNRTALVFQTLARVYGKDRLAAAFARYTRRYRFAHPTPDDFLALLGEVAGSDAADNARRALFDGAGVDYLVRGLRSRAVAAPHGDFDGEPPPAPPAGFISRFVVLRHGALSFPVDVAFETETGETLHERWDGRERWRVFEHSGPSRVVSVVVDPERAVLIDDDLLNNAARVEPRSAPHTAERSLFAVELLLGALEP
jgi:peptidase M1-like protein